MAVLKVGKTVYGNALLVSLSSKPPYAVAAKAIQSAPVGVSRFLPGFDSKPVKILAATPLEMEILRNG